MPFVNRLPAGQSQRGCADGEHAGHPEHHGRRAVGAPDDFHQHRRERVTHRGGQNGQRPGPAKTRTGIGPEDDQHAPESDGDGQPLRAMHALTQHEDREDRDEQRRDEEQRVGFRQRQFLEREGERDHHEYRQHAADQVTPSTSPAPARCSARAG